MSHSDVLQKVSSHFAELMIAKIESMTESWQKPWIFGQGVLPYNIVSGRTYTGANILTLLMLTEVKGYQSPVFVTFKQAKELGLQVRKGSKQFPVIFWKPFYLAATPVEGKPRYLSVEDFNNLSESERKEYVLRFSLRFYPVLNLDQTDFAERYPQRWQQILDRQAHPRRPAGTAHPTLERMLEAQSWVCPIRLKVGDRASYSPADDIIVVPLKEQFSDLEAFYSTLLHEMSHSTGTADRLDRHFEDRSRQAYGREELVAEFSAALAGCGLGISSGIRSENVAYLKGWLEKIRAEPAFIFSVLSDVRQVVRFIGERLDAQLFGDTQPDDIAG